MKNEIINPQDINGWGVDANPQNDPTYPMKKHSIEEHRGYKWERPAQQAQTVEILQSTERPNLSAVYGTSSPPSGLSGMIRRKAFKYSESSFGHWLPLILADRVNEIEGIIDDLKKGHIPNIFAERGLNAEWKYNKAAFTKKIAITAITAIVAISICSMLKRKR